jgi:hypothetical protein
MRAAYRAPELEGLLADAGLLTYEHLDARAATSDLFSEHNRAYPGRAMAAPAGVGYVLAVRR